MEAILTQPAVAKIGDDYIHTFPKDLYIPPDALRVLLEQFEGPLDLLLYLTKKQNIDIVTINVALITDQYIAYIDKMNAFDLELAADYLAMAAWLTELKSRYLLPTTIFDDDEEQDPRAALLQRLQTYSQIKEAARFIDEMPQYLRDVMPANAYMNTETSKAIPALTLEQLTAVFAGISKRAELSKTLVIEQHVFSVTTRISNIKSLLAITKGFCSFSQCFEYQEGLAGVVVSFVAILEMLRDNTIVVTQPQLYDELHIRGR